MEAQVRHDSPGVAVPDVATRRGAVGGTAPRLLRWSRRQPLGAFGAVVAILLVLAAWPALFAPDHYANDFNVTERLRGPSSDYPLGTDQLGRDQLSRIIYGARTSVIIGFGSILVSGILATTIGVVSAYFRGWFDTALQRFVDVWMAFPGLIFIVFIVSIFGNSTTTIIVTLGMLFGMGSSRIIRSAALSVGSRTYTEAARAVGASDLRIILRHIIPNVAPIIMITASVQIGAVILAESSLSFLGFGTPPPFPSWGRMLQEAQSLMQEHPHLALFPGLAIAVTVYAFNMLGDALRDTWDPRLRGNK